jgi:hypothetical protein
MSFEGLCYLENVSDGTALYQIQLIFPHHTNTAAFKVYDQLRQNNVKFENNKCDESWSIDNLTVEAWTVD